MQYTPNYNLITVEGTDVVNPLVQMNPNFTDIDAAMFANKQAVIGSATELTSGTVHSITRLNPDSNYFRFTAVSNWNAGDSMSVDGVNVSVYLSDGTTPPTGAYIINTEVLALLSGSRVTLITSTGSVNAAGVSYDNSLSGLTASNVQNAIDEVNDGMTANKLASVYTLTLNTDFIVPADGYVEVNSSGTFLRVRVKGSNNDINYAVNVSAENSMRNALFVRKGMILVMDIQTSPSDNAIYKPLS